MKIYDFEGMFEEKLSAYMKKHAAEYTEAQWETLIPQLYVRFGATPIKSVGSSPCGFYAALSDDEIILQLKARLKQGVAIDKFLANSIEGRNSSALLIPLLAGTEEEIKYALNFLGADRAAVDEYMRLLSEPLDEEIKNSCVDFLKQFADEVKDAALLRWEKGEYTAFMLEILSRCTLPDDRVFDALITAFRTCDDQIPLYANYLSLYGDERALPYLYDKIDSEGITYGEYRELKYAIESLGGTYESERDFSDDHEYLAVKAHSADEVDLFSAFNDKK